MSSWSIDMARAPLAAMRRELRDLTRAELALLDEGWLRDARDNQLPPPDGWRVWLILAGRGFGKTRAGAEWVRAQAESHGGARIALVAATQGEGRAVMVEGESGLLAIAPDRARPAWEPSLRRLTWPNGAQATLYSAAEPEGLRGPQHHFAWADEIAKWPNAVEAWDNLAMGMRLGDAPRTVATTTPRPVPLVRRLIAERGVAVTRGSTADNRANLPESFLAAMSELYGGTRLGRQELDGEMIEEVAGSLWPRALIEAWRVRDPQPMRRIVVAVDPPAGSSAGDGDECGIVVAGLAEDGTAHVIEDASLAARSPAEWAAAVARAAERHEADRVIAEANNGGAMVEAVLRAADARLPVRLVRASRGKVARAEPVAALFASGHVPDAGGPARRAGRGWRL